MGDIMKYLLSFFLLVTFVLGDGLFYGNAIDDTTDHTGTFLRLVSSDLVIDINDQAGSTTIHQTFQNDYDYPSTGTYFFPLPYDGNATGFAYLVDSTWIEAVIQPGEQDTVTGPSNPGQLNDLIAYLGSNPFMVAITDTIPPQSSIVVQLQYMELLPYNFGLVEYSYPLAPTPFDTQLQYDLSLQMSVFTQRDMDSIGVNIPEAVLTVQSSNHAEVSVDADQYIPDIDFNVVMELSQDELGLWTMSYTDTSDTNFFLLFTEPDNDYESAAVIPKNFVFIIDKSESMRPDWKLPRVRIAAEYCVTHLNENDYFNLIVYNHEIDSLFLTPVPATEDNISQAVVYINELEAGGSTNIYDALMSGLNHTISEEYLNMIVFLTDGLPFAGITDPYEIWTDVTEANVNQATIFTFGVGDEDHINLQLLEWIAYLNGGYFLWSQPDGPPVNEVIINFFRRVSNPVLTNISLDFGSIVTNEVYPEGTLHLFAGSQLLLAGQFETGGLTTIGLSGSWLDADTLYQFDVEFVEDDTANTFIPRFWAKQKIDHLLRMIRLHGENEDWVDEIIDLSMQYGIQTPYTHFGFIEPGEDPPDDPGDNLGIFDQNLTLPALAEVYPNYPNPFNQETTLRFYVPEPMIVTIRIFDLTGRLVWTQSIPVGRRGNYSIPWNGQTNMGIDLDTGIYLVQYQFRNHLMMQKVMMVK